MSIEENKEVVRRVVEEGTNKGNAGVLEEIMAPTPWITPRPRDNRRDRKGSCGAWPNFGRLFLTPTRP